MHLLPPSGELSGTEASAAVSFLLFTTLHQIIPAFFSVIRQPAPRMQEFHLQQLAILVYIIKQHIRNYLADVLDMVKELWSNPSLEFHVVNLIESLARALNAEFKPFVATVLPPMIKVSGRYFFFTLAWLTSSLAPRRRRRRESRHWCPSVPSNLCLWSKRRRIFAPNHSYHYEDYRTSGTLNESSVCRAQGFGRIIPKGQLFRPCWPNSSSSRPCIIRIQSVGLQESGHGPLVRLDGAARIGLCYLCPDDVQSERSVNQCSTFINFYYRSFSGIGSSMLDMIRW